MQLSPVREKCGQKRWVDPFFGGISGLRVSMVVARMLMLLLKQCMDDALVQKGIMLKGVIQL